MKKIFSIFLSFIYSFLSLFGLSFNNGEKIWTEKVNFEIKCKTDVILPPEEVWVNGTDYPSVIELADGKLLASAEVFNRGECGFRIMASDDSGDTWTQRAFVTETLDKTINASWNPCLMELPEAMGIFPKGTVILAAVSIDHQQSRKSQISVYASTDGGSSWTEISVIDEAGGIDEGVWEPYLVYEDGYVYCFYSDDADEACSQTIVYKRSSDCINWEGKVSVVKSGNPDERPGMPVLTKMGNGKWFLCYEYGRDGGYPIYYKTSDSIGEWNPADTGTLLKAGIKRTAVSAPSCIWIPEGGNKGTLIVSAKAVDGKRNDLFISNNYGKHFKMMKNPLDYSDKRGFGYHAAFYWSEKNNVLYYANAVDYVDDLSKISFVRMSPKSRLR